jgi:L-asparaginase
MSILVITTGGTIGALPFADIKRQPLIKSMPADGFNIVRTVLENDLDRSDLRFEPMEPRDSQLIDVLYRSEMCALILQASEPRVLITHGTDTLLETAEYLYHATQTFPALREKTIIITGAMVAISCGPESEGLLNLQHSLMQFDRPLGHGVYIVLSDFEDPVRQTGWAPQLYGFEPGKYGKTHDNDNMDRNRLFELTGEAL